MIDSPRHSEAALGRDRFVGVTRWARVAVAVSLVAYLLVAGSGAFSRVMPWRLTTILGLALFMTVWAVGCMISRSWRPRARLAVPVLVVAIAYAASAIASTQQRLSFEPTVFGLGAVAIFLISERLLEREDVRTLVRIAAIAMVTIVVVGYLASVLVQWVEWWGLVGRLSRPPIRPGSMGFLVGGPNSMAGFPMLIGPLAIAELVRHRRRGKLAAILLAGLILAAAFISGSRGGALGLGAGLIVLLTALPTVSDRMRRGARVALAVGIIVLAVALVALVVASRGGEDGIDLRLHLWDQSLRIATEHPLLGSGPGTWEIARYGVLRPGDDTSLVSHAHNVAVQTLAELGIVGLLAWALLLIAVSVLLAQLLRHRPDRRTEVVALAIGLASLLGQSIVENFTDIPLMTLSAVVLVAYADALAGTNRRIMTTLATTRLPAADFVWATAGSAVIVLSLFAGGASVRFERASMASERGDLGLRGLAPTDYQARRMILAVSAAANLDPGFPIYQAQLGTALASRGRVAEARTAFERASRLDRFWGWSIDLAWVEEALGDSAAATARIKDAASIYAADLPVLSNAAALSAATGDVSAAQAYLAQLFAASPRLAVEPGWWIFSPVGGRVPAAIHDAKVRLSGNPLALAELDLWTHSLPDARSALALAPASPARNALQAAAAWFNGEKSRARTDLQDLAEREPLNVDAVGWALRFARDAGDRQATARYTRWLQILDPVGGAPYLSVDGTSPTDRLQQLLAVPLHASSAYQRFLRSTSLMVPAVVGSSGPPAYPR
jgi:O-antigen ligase/Tfp pilus assembly protein PilF